MYEPIRIFEPQPGDSLTPKKAPKPRKRWRRSTGIGLAFAIVLTGIGFILFKPAYLAHGTGSSGGRSPAPAALPGIAERDFATAEVAGTAPASQTPLSARDVALVSHAKARFLHQLQESERLRSKVLERRETDQGASAMVVISEPPRSEFVQLSQAIGQNLAGLPPESSAYRQAYAELSSDLTAFTYFPKPFKFVAVAAKPEQNNQDPGWWGSEALFEWFAASDTINTDAAHEPAIPSDGVRSDNFGEKSEWAAKRYSYLLKLTPPSANSDSAPESALATPAALPTSEPALPFSFSSPIRR